MCYETYDRKVTIAKANATRFTDSVLYEVQIERDKIEKELNKRINVELLKKLDSENLINDKDDKL